MEQCPRGATEVTVTFKAAGAPQDRDGGHGDSVNPYLHVDHPSLTIPQHNRVMSTALHPSPSAVYTLVAESEQSEYENKSGPAGSSLVI